MFGFLADRRILSAIDMNTFCAATLTISIFVYYALRPYWLQCLFSVFFAFSIGKSILDSKQIGLDKKTR